MEALQRSVFMRASNDYNPPALPGWVTAFPRSQWLLGMCWQGCLLWYSLSPLTSSKVFHGGTHGNILTLWVRGKPQVSDITFLACKRYWYQSSALPAKGSQMRDDVKSASQMSQCWARWTNVQNSFISSSTWDSLLPKPSSEFLSWMGIWIQVSSIKIQCSRSLVWLGRRQVHLFLCTSVCGRWC